MEERLIFLYNRTSCIGCGSCQVACKDEHALGPGQFFRKVSMQEMEKGGQHVFVPLSLSCNHCEHPACVGVCPTGAMYQTPEGLVLHNDDLCIACGRCYWACPYGEISMSAVSGLAQKCDSCERRRAAGLEPACVAACPTRSLRFGTREELLGSPLEAPFLPEYSVTQPSTRLNSPFSMEDKENE